MERILDRLKDEMVLDLLIRRELEALWKHGIAAIADEPLSAAVTGFLAGRAPLGFFTKGATKSGKHHPSWQNGRAGILRNTVECCLVLPGLATSLPDFLGERKEADRSMLDVSFAATILSDVFKWDAAGQWNSRPHEIVGAAAWSDYALPLVKSTNLRLDMMMRVESAVRWHHGIWSAGFKRGQRLTPETWLVHLTDTFFAQKQLGLLYEPKSQID